MLKIALAPVAFVALIVSLTACSSFDRRITSFEPMANNEFRYQAFADATYSPTDPDDEAIRLNWLQQYLNDNDLCANGYEITDRKQVLKSKSAFADIYDIIYYGRCN
jgi:major membrane immunogen (membrane-anchored lipoprotein)